MKSYVSWALGLVSLVASNVTRFNAARRTPRAVKLVSGKNRAHEKRTRTLAHTRTKENPRRGEHDTCLVPCKNPRCDHTNTKKEVAKIQSHDVCSWDSLC
jgi:hypothetical protein